jgi:hypothetical protein
MEIDTKKCVNNIKFLEDKKMLKENLKNYILLAVIAVVLVLIAANFNDVCATITKLFQL